MSYKLILMCSCVYLCCSCNEHKSTADLTKDTISSSLIKPVYTDTIEFFFQSKGVLVFNSTDKNLSKDAKILNNDNTVFATYNLAKNQIVIGESRQPLNDFSKENHLRIQSEFFPKEFYPEQSVIQFEYTNIVDGFAEIIVNKDKQIKKRIELKDSLYTVEPWKKHLIGSIVDFNPRLNPVHESKLDDSSVIIYESGEDVVFVISEISGDWMKIECAERCGFSCPAGKKIAGWIKWRKGSKLLIRLAYSC
jgi:hypothetical protein